MNTGWGILGMAALVAVTLPAAGCSTACPAIGYVSTIQLAVQGDTEAVHEVQLCSDEGCSAPEPPAAPPRPLATPDGWVAMPGGGFSPKPGPDIPAPTYPDAPFLSFKPSAGKWVFHPAGARNGTPDRVTLRALAADGTVLAEQEHDLNWTKEDPFNPCGSPVTTPPIAFQVGQR